MAECPPLVSDDVIVVHAPDWDVVEDGERTIYHCTVCGIAHVDHEPTERQHAQHAGFLAQERRRQGHRAMQARRIGYYHGRGR